MPMRFAVTIRRWRGFAALGLLLPAALGWAGDKRPAAAPDPISLVQRADELLRPPASAIYETIITSFAGSVEGEKGLYRISVDGAGKSLLEMLNPADRGKKILSLPSKGLWMYFPASQRPVRLTPNQMLLGQASIGDVLRGNWANDYAVKSSVASPCIGLADQQECLLLQLEAVVQEPTYGRIDLFVRPDTGIPVGARLYSISGKLLKTAQFDPPVTLGGKRFVATIWLKDEVNARSEFKTQYVITSVKFTPVPAATFSVERLSSGL
jgi:hypothetical protein